VGLGEDLGAKTLAVIMPTRAVRSYPAMLSTESDAQAWGRAGGPAGGVVVADYQASPRGRGGFEWTVTPGRGLGFTLLLHPPWPPEREGWPYLPACLALADVVGAGATLTWPDAVHHGDARAAAVGVHTELAPGRIAWATVTVLVEDARPPRAPLLRDAVEAIERRLEQPAEAVLDEYRAACTTLGRRVTARLVPMGPAEVRVTGEAVDCRDDGSLVIVNAEDRRVAVPPQHLGLLEPAD
jgi:BirA family transcriptional regulator, biotin operon repressor / biotin---[acetyl-CoA-carboxylase] ligase